MKKIMLLALTALIMVGCDKQQIADSITKDYFGVCVYDSYEYLIAMNGYEGFLAHKGNCKYCKERRQKEVEELIKRLKKK
jgi:hypothetical protein